MVVVVVVVVDEDIVEEAGAEAGAGARALADQGAGVLVAHHLLAEPANPLPLVEPAELPLLLEDQSLPLPASLPHLLEDPPLAVCSRSIFYLFLA